MTNLKYLDKSFSFDLFLTLFSSSSEKGNLITFSTLDYGNKIKVSELSVNQVDLGVYYQIKKKNNHDYDNLNLETLEEIEGLEDKNSFFTSKKNFQEKFISNFADENIDDLYFITLTFNNSQRDIYSKAFPGSTLVKENLNLNSSQKKIKVVPSEICEFLAPKRVSKRGLNGANDYFADFTTSYFKNVQPKNRKYVAVSELHRCQTTCHWKKKKIRKTSDIDHDENLCNHNSRHDCIKQWHFHMIVHKDFFPSWLNKDPQSDLSKGYSQNHRFFLNNYWLWGFVHIEKMKKKVGIKNEQNHHGYEKVIKYLMKYLSKSFSHRQDNSSVYQKLMMKLNNVNDSKTIEYLNKRLQLLKKRSEFGKKYGILKGVSSYKFFREEYIDEKNKFQHRIKKPEKESHTFIVEGDQNAEYLKDHFYISEKKYDDSEKVSKRINFKKNDSFSIPDINELISLCEFIILCGNLASSTNINPISFFHNWKREVITKYTVKFRFEGEDYDKHWPIVLEFLKKLNLPVFKKFKDWDPDKEEESIRNYLAKIIPVVGSHWNRDEIYPNFFWKENEFVVGDRENFLNRSMELYEENKDYLFQDGWIPHIYNVGYLDTIHSRLRPKPKESERTNWAASVDW